MVNSDITYQPNSKLNIRNGGALLSTLKKTNNNEKSEIKE